jgi:hypothetical protein
MKKLVLGLFAAALMLPAIAVDAQTYVHGYYRKDGTYVQPHYRSSPNGTTLDNYSTRGNINPYTGQVGTRDPYYRSPSNSYSNPYSNPYRSNTYSNPYSNPFSSPYSQPRTTPCYYNCPE